MSCETRAVVTSLTLAVSSPSALIEISKTLLHLGVVRGEVAMVIINQKLTPLYVQYEAIQAQQKMVNSPNHTEIYIPVGPTDVPVVSTMKLG